MNARLVSRVRLAPMLGVALLASCQSSGVTIPPRWQDLKPCRHAGAITVEELEDMGKPGCNMVGTTVRFPDGSTGEVGAVGANKSWSYVASSGDATIPKHFTMVNWGVPGVAVTEFDKSERVKRVWASTSEASDLQGDLD